MKPSLLHRQLVTNHGEFKGKPAEFFKCKTENVSKTSNIIRNFTQLEVALQISCELPLLAAKKKITSHSGVSLISPGALIIANEILDKKKIRKCNNNDSELQQNCRSQNS
jgi:hypothetical protein